MEQDALFSDKILCELYHGSLSPENKKLFQRPHILFREKRIDDLYAQLLAAIPEEQKETCDLILQNYTEIQMLREAEVFQYAFKLGARMTLEILDKPSS